MHNWKATIGFMLPSSCLVYEQEFHAIVQNIPGVVGVAARLLIEECDADGLRKMNAHIDLAARQLATCDPDLVVYMCTSGSFMDGSEGEEALRKRIHELTGKPVISTSQAVLMGLSALGIRKVVVLTPYNEDLTRREIEWLEENGIEVLDFHYSDIPENLDRGSRQPQKCFCLARQLGWQDADGILISCANVRSLEIVEELEAYTGKPVISSSLATTWLALRQCRIRTVLQGFGRLFDF